MGMRALGLDLVWLTSGLLFVACAGGSAQPEPGSEAAGRAAAGTSSVATSGSAGATPDGGSPGASGSASGGGPAGAGDGTVAGAGSGGQLSAAGSSNQAGQALTGGTGGGGGSGGGAAGGAGGSAVAGGAGASSCAGLVCEDFESGKIDTDKWELQAKGGTVTVEQQRVAHGTYAAQVHSTGASGDDWALLVLKNVPAALKGPSTFGRAMMYAAANETVSIHVQMAFAGHNGTGTANGPAPFSKLRYMEVASNGTRWQLGFDLLDLSPLVEEVSYSKGRVTTDAWICLEWQFEDSPDRVAEWVDGTQVGTFDNTNVGYASPGPTPSAGGALWDGKSSGLIGGFDFFGFGMHDWHPQKEFDIYYDDVVLDSKRVGCPPK